MPEGRQSPPPEEQSGVQKDAPSSGQGVNKDSGNQNQSKKDLEGLSSNPTAPLDQHAKDTVSKTLDNATENSKA